MSSCSHMSGITNKKVLMAIMHKLSELLNAEMAFRYIFGLRRTGKDFSVKGKTKFLPQGQNLAVWDAVKLIFYYP